MRRSTRNFIIPPGKARPFELLKIGSFKFPPPRAKRVFKFPYPIVEFVCQGLFSAPAVFYGACVQTSQNMSRDPLHDNAVYKRKTLLLKLLKIT